MKHYMPMAEVPALRSNLVAANIFQAWLD